MLLAKHNLNYNWQRIKTSETIAIFFYYYCRTMIRKIFTFGILFLLSVSCSSTKQNTNEESDDNGVYVFDEVPAGDSFQIDNEEKDLNFNYFVQIGAFTTKASAEDFVDGSANNLNEELVIKYSSISNVYTVRLKELFTSRIEAEKKRNELWQDDKFKDAWIVKENK